MCLMPAVCAKCDKEFDITEDLKAQTRENFEEQEMREQLCWECRLREKLKRRN